MAVTAPTALTYTPPDRSTQTPSAFSDNADDCVNQLKTFSTEMVTAVGQLNDDIDQVNTDTQSIISAADSAVAAANFLGNWSSLTGAASAGDSVKHDGLRWSANTDIADITTEEPGVSGDWDQIGGVVREARTANIKFVTIDFGKIIDYTSGTFTQTFDPAATLGEGWVITLANSGTGTVTLDPDGAETISGSATLDLLPGRVYIVTCDGSNLFATLIVSSSADNEVYLHTGNGYGSTNTKIRRYTTALRNVGSAITYADTAAAGASFTINEDGLYAIRMTDRSIQLGISKNSAELTTNIYSITAADRIVMVIGSSSVNNIVEASATVRLEATDVIRPHTNGATPSESAADNTFVITKVGV